ncbi:MAG TPA: type II secretion system protein GspM [Roseiarcus sp.]|nr:type II secretion system protein GspM [Roseiarcus sp.]
MFGLNRRRLFALLTLSAFLLVCAMAPTVALKARSDALVELSDAKDLLGRLTNGQRRPGVNAGDRPQTPEAPATAFVNAQTPGLAIAQLETYLSNLAEPFHASLISFSGEQPDRADTPEIIRIRANIDLEYDALQPLLYKLEAGAPYVFVDSLTLRPSNARASGARAANMKAAIGLKALWRQGPT